MNVEISWVDGVMLAVLVLSLAVGAWRGLVFEVLAIVGWFVAYFAAQAITPMLAPHFPIGSAGSLLNQGATFASVFIASLIVWSLLSRLVRRMVRATPLAPVDRMLGAGFGLLRGVIVLLVVAAVVAYTPWARSPAWQASIGAAWLQSTWHALKPLLPSVAANLLRA